MRRDGLPNLFPSRTVASHQRHDRDESSASDAAAMAAPIIPASLRKCAGTISARLTSNGPKCAQFSVTPPPMMNASTHSSAW